MTRKSKWMMAAMAGMLLAGGTSYAISQATVVEQSHTVRVIPRVSMVTVQAISNMVTTDTTRVFAVAVDGQGRRLTGRFTFQILNTAGQPDTTILAIRAFNDTSALIIAKTSGTARVNAIFIGN